MKPSSGCIAVAFFLAGSFLVSSGCNGSAANAGAGGAGASTTTTSSTSGAGGAEAPSSDQLAAAADAGSAVTSIDQMLTIADLMFKFDPDLHPDTTAAANTSTIKQNATTQTAGCANVKVNQAAGITVDFGAAPGCTLSGGAVVSGSLGVMVSKVDATSTLTVDLTFTSLVVNGITLNGSASFVTTDGSTFTVTLSLDVQNGSKTSPIDGTITVVGSPGAITVSGAITTGLGPMTLANVLLQQGTCYSSGGTVAVQNTALGNPTLTFDAMTPSTAKASLTVQTPQGKALPPSTITLPPYGTCPHA